jgi:hypothetical protein
MQMRPSRVLRFYCAASFAIGLLASLPLALWVHEKELSLNASAVLTLSLNVLLLMILPLVLDWSEHKYFKARFVQLEELSQSNPELKAILDEQCHKLSLPGLRLAAVDMPVGETFTYGFWRQNPRLVVPESWLHKPASTGEILPSIEIELTRFAKRDVTFVYLAFCAVQVVAQYALGYFVFH